MAMAPRPTAGDQPWTVAGGQIYDSVQGPMAALYQVTTQSIANNASQPIFFDGENFDTHNGHDNVTNNSRWTCPSGWDGYYMVSGVVFFASGATGVRLCWLRKNGTTEVTGSVNRRQPFAGADGDGMPTPACVISLAAGDYVELLGLHTQGSAVSTLSVAQYVSGLNIAFQRF